MQPTGAFALEHRPPPKPTRLRTKATRRRPPPQSLPRKRGARASCRDLMDGRPVRQLAVARQATSRRNSNETARAGRNFEVRRGFVPVWHAHLASLFVWPYQNFYDNLSIFAARVKGKLPNVQAVYTSSRIYGGFAMQRTAESHFRTRKAMGSTLGSSTFRRLMGSGTGGGHTSGRPTAPPEKRIVAGIATRSRTTKTTACIRRRPPARKSQR